MTIYTSHSVLKRHPQSLRKNLIRVLVFFLICPPYGALAQTNTSTGKDNDTKDIIEKFSKDFCQNNPVDESDSAMRLSKDASGKLNDVLMQLKNEGIKDVNDFNRSKYDGVLTNELGQKLKNNQKCQSEMNGDLSKLLSKDSGSYLGWVLAGGAAVGVAVLASSGSSSSSPSTPPPSGNQTVAITYPAEGSIVGWDETIKGNSTGCDTTCYVSISVQPYGSEWFPQSSRGVVTRQGGWEAPHCYFGLQNNPNDIGHGFRFKAELRDSGGNVKASHQIERVTRQ
jgi:hypothetical protein